MVSVEWKDEVPDHTTVTGGVVVIAMVAESSGIMKNTRKKRTSQQHEVEHTSIGLQSRREGTHNDGGKLA